MTTGNLDCPVGGRARPDASVVTLLRLLDAVAGIAVGMLIKWHPTPRPGSDLHWLLVSLPGRPPVNS
jgi:hypothetical protein